MKLKATSAPDQIIAIVQPRNQNPGIQRLVLVISSLGSGGAERVLSMLANHWAEQGREIVLITLSTAASDFFPPHPKINRVALDLLRDSRGALDALLQNKRRLAGLRQAIRNAKPQAVLSFTDVTNIMVLLATRGFGIPVIVSERIDPRYHSIGRFWSAARALTYRWSDALVVQTEAVRPWGEKLVSSRRIFVIPNPLQLAGTGQSIDSITLPRHPYIVAMGRLHLQKGFDLLLRAFAQVAQSYSKLSLVILGEGEERQALLDLAQNLGIGDRVHLPGRVQNASVILGTADLFVLSSRYEGFPNALLEAMGSGCAVISFDCPSGPADIIQHDRNGILVPAQDVDELARQIHHLIEAPDLRNALGKAAREVGERYSLPTIAAQWDGLITSNIQKP